MVQHFSALRQEHWERLNPLRKSTNADSATPHIQFANQLPHGLPFYLSAFFLHQKSNFVIVLPGEKEASRLASEMRCLLDTEKSVLHLPSQGMPQNLNGSAEQSLLANRIAILDQLSSATQPQCIVTSLQGCLEKTPRLQQREAIAICCELEQSISPLELCRQLAHYGYARCPQVEFKGDYCLKGEVLDIVCQSAAIRITFDDETIETMRTFDLFTQRSDAKQLQQVSFFPVTEHFISREEWAALPENLACQIDQSLETVPDSFPPPSKKKKKRSHGQDASGDHLLSEAKAEADAEAEDHPPIEGLRGSAPEDAPRGSAKRGFQEIVVLSAGEWQEWGPRILEFLPQTSFLDSFDSRTVAVFVHAHRLQASTQEMHEMHEIQADDSSLASFLDLASCQTKKTYIFDNYEHQDASANSFNYDPRLAGIHENAMQPGQNLDRQLQEVASRVLEKREKIYLSSSTTNGLKTLAKLFSRFLPESSISQAAATSPSSSLSSSSSSLSNASKGVLTLIQSPLRKGFFIPDLELCLLTDLEILGRRAKTRTRVAGENLAPIAVDYLFDVREGDYVVHLTHGIGKFEKLEKVKTLGVWNDFMIIHYAGDSRLMVPIDQIAMVQKYIGGGGTPPLDSLGKASFRKTKQKMQIQIQEFAEKIVQMQAYRHSVPGVSLAADNEVQYEFAERFRFEETQDQLRAIEAVTADLESGNCMDRLLCGDVGYGKTEVAMRAAFKNVMSGKQVLVVVPTTILALQHIRTFRNRMRDYPIRLACLTRFQSKAELMRIQEDLAETKIDILIGTHATLSGKFDIPNLSLVIIDEEQKFGVLQKEKIKQQFKRIHVLSMSATPIPRTLHLAMSSIRDISIMNTPPPGRKPVKTYIIDPLKTSLLAEAVERELRRRGQIYFLHNSIATLEQRATWFFRTTGIQTESLMIHGRMQREEIQEKLLLFYQGKASILFATSIIENGIDIPNVNTLIIDEAEKFGLAQLYQLRGRVGRSPKQAYAYLMHDSRGAFRKERARQRMLAILESEKLGSGFQIAMRDLEIRGAGNLLGRQQSGTMHALGYELYTRMLHTAIERIQQDGLAAATRVPTTSATTPSASAASPVIGDSGEDSGSQVGPKVSPKVNGRYENLQPCHVKLNTDAFLPEAYLPDVYQRMDFYKRLSAASTRERMDRLSEELADRFGPLPLEAQRFIGQEKIRVLGNQIGIIQISERKISGLSRAILEIGERIQIPLARLLLFIQQHASRLQMKSVGAKELIYLLLPDISPENQLLDLLERLRKLQQDS